MLAEIDAALQKDEDISPDIFDAAFLEIIRLLELDKFPR